MKHDDLAEKAAKVPSGCAGCAFVASGLFGLFFLCIAVTALLVLVSFIISIVQTRSVDLRDFVFAGLLLGSSLIFWYGAYRYLRYAYLHYKRL